MTADGQGPKVENTQVTSFRDKTDVIQTAVEIQLSGPEAEHFPNALPKFDPNPNMTGNEWVDGQPDSQPNRCVARPRPQESLTHSSS